MQLLIDKVNTQLFVVVVGDVYLQVGKVLEAKYVQKADCLGFVPEARVIDLLGLDCSVHFLDQPIEHVVE